MDNIKIQTLKGFRDFLPNEVRKRNYLVGIMKQTFELFGFEPLETPTLEYKDLLTGKMGGEAEKLMYSFKDLGGRDVAMRYDQTIPTARILAIYHQQLPMPWRRYQIQNVFRAENPQAGRFREFLHCDVDIFGSTCPLADAETIVCVNQTLKRLGFEKFTIYINDRNILFKLMDFSSIPQNKHLAVIAEIDKLDRKSKEEVREELKTLGLSDKTIDHLYEHIDTAKPTDELTAVIKHALELGVDQKTLKFHSRLARGLDYYTSTIFEAKIDDYQAGSVAGGGRYDNLIKTLSGVDIPAVGVAFGFDRIFEALEQFNLFPKDQKESDVLVGVFNKDLADESAAVVDNLRQNNIICEIYPAEQAKLSKQLKYADNKDIKYFIVIGPDEVKNNSVILKDLKSGHQEEVKLKNLPSKIKGSKS